MKRASGVLMHISSLPGSYGCGSLGKSAYDFVDLLKDCGFSYWQMLPVGICDECNSPYKSPSAFAGNPFFVDLDALAKKGLITEDELKAAEQSTPYVCEYDRLRAQRLPLLLKASKRTAERREIESFAAANREIDEFCTFAALKDANGGLPHNEWKTDRLDGDILFMWKFIQYEFFGQWAALKKYSESRGIKLIGDMPIYVDADSSDFYYNNSLFLTDKEGNPAGVAGVPPDYFSADGQLWGNPLYDYEKMESDGFAWWKRRVSKALELFDGLRIDHFRGFESFFSVPSDAKTAREGKWVKGPGKKLIDAIKSVSGEKLIIAEDLGDITPEVKELVDYSGFPGMRVFQFAFLGGDNPHLTHNFEKNCVAYSGTHDNNTLLGYLWELDGGTRQKMLEYCGFKGDDWGQGCDDIIRTLFASSAGLLMLPIQDVLGFGSDTRLNRPGIASGNWAFRVTAEQLSGVDRSKYYKLNQTYFRGII